MPDEKMRAWFIGENLQAAIPNPRAEHENFCDYWRAKAGSDARKLDWPATWRRWMRTAASRSASNGYRPNGSGQSKTNDRVIQGLSLAAKYEEQGL
jgi:hypothetical protein